jgi:hypothetical protein
MNLKSLPQVKNSATDISIQRRRQDDPHTPGIRIEERQGDSIHIFELFESGHKVYRGSYKKTKGPRYVY